jgi:hypothetical protein
MFAFTESQYNEFDEFLSDMKGINWGAWPANEIGYITKVCGVIAQPYEQDNGKMFVVVKFDTL